MNKFNEGYETGMELMRKLLHLEDTLNSLYQVIGHVEKFQGVDSEKKVDSSLELVNKSVAGKLFSHYVSHCALYIFVCC